MIIIGKIICLGSVNPVLTNSENSIYSRYNRRTTVYCINIERRPGTYFCTTGALRRQHNKSFRLTLPGKLQLATAAHQIRKTITQYKAQFGSPGITSLPASVQ